VSRAYRTIVADPPWHYDGFATGPGDPRRGRERDLKSSALPYGSLSVDEIKEIPVAGLADNDCFLFLWTTSRYLPAAFEVAVAWGFAYRQMLVWHKTGNPSPFGGTVAPNHAEYILVAAKGSPTIGDRLPGSVLSIPKPYQHSLKPEAFLDYIEAASPEPRLEMFARRARFGWDYWGDQSLGTAEMPEQAHA
jgi:N6-adenosine-specific RNA methylase IME4